jgi:hypothetical protein
MECIIGVVGEMGIYEGDVTPSVRKSLVKDGYYVERVTNKGYDSCGKQSCTCQICVKPKTIVTWKVLPGEVKPETEIDKIIEQVKSGAEHHEKQYHYGIW